MGSMVIIVVRVGVGRGAVAGVVVGVGVGVRGGMGMRAMMGRVSEERSRMIKSRGKAGGSKVEWKGMKVIVLRKEERGPLR